MRTRVQTSAEIAAHCTEWAQEIERDFKPDLVLFIATSGFLFAKPMAKQFGCDIVDIRVSRIGNKIKDRLKSLIKCIPQKIILALVSSQLKYYFNDKKCERTVQITPRYQAAVRHLYKKILIVDDAVDTGWTMNTIKEKVKKDFPAAEIKTAAYMVSDFSGKHIKIDFWKYKNEIVLNPTSRKIEGYQEYIDSYKAWSRYTVGGIE